ncbi:MAG: hypothetical protein H0W97_02035 [Actinobacteria bacterium]|nr:hypothetical protein [Actinomycetota bacterium]
MSKQAINYLLGKCREVTTTAEESGRGLTHAERELVKGYLAEVDEFRENEAMREGRWDEVSAKTREEFVRDQAESAQLKAIIDGREAVTATGGTFSKAVMAAGFSLRENPSVTIPLSAAIGTKASTFPANTDWYRTTPVISGLGQDGRFLYPYLEQQNVEGAASVQTFRQTGARTVTGTVERVLGATTDKATLGLTLTLVNEALKEQAVIIDAVPNAVMESVDMLRQFLESEGKFQLNKSLDAHVMAQIVAAAPPFGTTGTTLIDKVRNGVASMRATGFDPDILVVNPTEGASLDLTADAGGYIFPSRDIGSSSPLFGLRVIERIGAGNEAPYLIDTSALGVIYAGTLRIEADPFAGAGGANFKKNLTDLRFELKALFHVRQAEGARRIAAT